ncbi:putative membrane protein [Actinoalloteichus hymeniacidonis]|uniref:Membrane protein n=1 Tax=Actinoalloteichus hymeniacidonis TaxID=340345 RepID=A0AAC9HMZ6_9PSEU|nr:putative membrane protein [Actinoalloteichus hymeniacidonis]
MDVVRGLALCGILFTNIPQLTYLMRSDENGDFYPIAAAMEFLFSQRFFPIFAYLFGLSFALFLDSAAKRTEKPYLVLLRRLLVLAVFGWLHQMIHPGEALLPYAIVGVVILLPVSLLPKPLILAGGVVGTLVPLAVTGGGLLLVPGLFLLGLATTRYGIVHTLAKRGWQLAALLAAGAITAAITLPLQADSLQHSGFNVVSGVAGFGLAVVYVTGLLLLLRTPVAPVLSAVFEPLGRMALTNYLVATVIIIAVDGPLEMNESGRWGVMLLLAVSILTLQTVFSRLWLRRFRYGPVEWLWRSATWWEWAPISRRTAQS